MNNLLYCIPALFCLWLAACSTSDDDTIFKEAYIAILNEYYSNTILHNCTFSFDGYHRFYRKPEFIDLRESKICDGHITIDDMEFFTDDSVKVDFRVAYSADRSFVREFMKGWEQLIERYKTLDSLRIPDHRYGYAWTYTDPYDQDIFIRYPDDPNGIFSTQRWKQLETVKSRLQELSDNRLVYSDSFTVVMVKKEDWEIVNEENTSGYSEDIRR